MRRALLSSLSCASLSLGLLAFSPLREEYLRHRRPVVAPQGLIMVRPSGGLAKKTAAPFTIDTCSDKQKLFNRLTNSTVPAGVKTNAITLIGEKTQSGLYRNFPVLDGKTIDDGILLSTGDANSINDSDSKIFSPELDKDVNPNPAFQRQEILDIAQATANTVDSVGKYEIYDLSSYKLSFTTNDTIKSFSVDFVYGSLEFPVFLYSNYNDLFLIFIDGKNIALDNQGKAISVGNNFFKVVNTPIVIDSQGKIEYDSTSLVGILNPVILIPGLTPPLRAQDNLKPGTHTLEFVIADINDGLLNSSVFLANLRFSTQGVIPGVTKASDLISDQSFTVPETLPAGSTVGVLQTLAARDSLKFTLGSGVPEILLDDKGNLVVAPGASLSKYRGQDVPLTVIVRQDFDVDTSHVIVHVTAVNPPPPPPPPLSAVSKALYLDPDGDGRIDAVTFEFAAAPSAPPVSLRLQDPFAPGASVTLAAGQITRLDATHFRADFPSQPFAYGTGFAPGPYGRILASAAVFDTAAFTIGDGVGPRPDKADAIPPQQEGDLPTLIVTFSEGVTVNLASPEFPFDIRRNGVDLSGITVGSVKNLGGNRYQYTLSSAAYPLLGDSLRLKAGTPLVVDVKGNLANMRDYIPVGGKPVPPPPAILKIKPSQLVSMPGLADASAAQEAVVFLDSASATCLNCRDAAVRSVVTNALAAPSSGKTRPYLFSLKASAPFRYQLYFYDNLGEFMNKATGQVGAAQLDVLPKDADGNHLLQVFWWPVSASGRQAGTGPYIMRGYTLTDAPIKMEPVTEDGFSSLDGGDKNIFSIFGYLRAE
jgi:hypothetical protein